MADLTRAQHIMVQCFALRLAVAEYQLMRDLGFEAGHCADHAIAVMWDFKEIARGP
jgi:hypothetical protein